MVKIRLSTQGKRNQRTFRVIAIEDGKRRGGRPIEQLGYYNPLVTPAQVVLKRDRISYWLSVGAQLTPVVEKLMKQ